MLDTTLGLTHYGVHEPTRTAARRSVARNSTSTADCARLLLMLGLADAPPPPPVEAPKPTQQERARKRVASGRSLEVVARELQVSAAQVAAWVNGDSA